MLKRDQLPLPGSPLNLRGSGRLERRRCVFLGRRFGVAAGESEKCFVERGAAQADVVDLDLTLDEEPERLCQLLGAPIGSDRDGPCVEIGTQRFRGDEPQNLLDRGEVSRLSGAYLEHVAA